MRRMLNSIVLVLLVASTPAVVHAQRPQPSVLFRAAHEAPEIERSLQGGIFGDGSSDHRYTGMWVGLGVGIGATLLGAAFCSDSDTACQPGQPWSGVPIVLPVLAVTGALIGGLFPKTPPPVGAP